MRNKSVSDFVAAAMDATLKSAEHRSLFGTQYKFASDENDAKCTKCASDKCTCGDSSMADDNDVKKGKMPPWLMKNKEEDSSKADDNDARRAKSSDEDSSNADDDDNDARRAKNSDDDSSDANDSSAEEMTSSAFDMAIDSLLTASAALDTVGMEKSASLSLKLASLVVEAKKKKVEDSKNNSAKNRDSNDARAKAKKKEDDKKAADKKKLEAEKKKADDKKKADSNAAKDKMMKEKAAKEAKEKAAKEKAAKEKARASSSSKK